MLLNCHSYYSLRYGTMTPGELVRAAVRYGYGALALTDVNCTTGIFEFVGLCKQAGIKPIAGITFHINKQVAYIGIAKNNKGFGELNAFLTHHNVHKLPLPLRAPQFEDVFVIYPMGKVPPATLLHHEFIGITLQDIRKLSLQKDPLIAKSVVWHPLVFETPEGFDLHKKLRAIDHATLLSKVAPAAVAPVFACFKPAQALEDAFAGFVQTLSATRALMEACSIDFETHVIRNKKTFTGDADEDRLLLKKLALDGWKERYGPQHVEALKRITHELAIIDQLGFCAYFLITWDIIRYSMGRGFYHVGRGSGANSIVAYCLKITDVCPMELDLYFERFLNPKRKSPPDFDIDYSWKERDEVLDYIFKRYGSKYTALLGTLNTFKEKSMARELGKVHGLPKNDIDGFVATRDLGIYAEKIGDFPNIRSIHAGGVLISEEPLAHYTALDMPPKGFPTVQFDMYLAEEMGFEKFDILSQRGIGHIKDCADLVYANKGVRIDVHDVKKFKTDERVRQQLLAGDTIGCFYIESPAMRGLLKKLHCGDYITLVAASSIIRPGVAKSGMMKQYIQRYHQPNGFTYLHPILKEQLHETFGIMVFQEDVLKVCHHFAGLDLADADVLRRMMSGKGKNTEALARIKLKFFDNCNQRGYAPGLTAEVWRQIESFAGYSFSKAHSASYAVESYQSLYLKTYFPLEFMVAVLNNFGGFYTAWVYVNEARKAGARIELPCVNNGVYTTSIKGDVIYLGFIYVQHLEQEVASLIVKERKTSGEYLDLLDFVQRTRVKLEQLFLLIKVGAFRFTGKSKKTLLWEAHALTCVLPVLDDSLVEDLYDEIELMGFPVSGSLFDLLKTSFRSSVLASDLVALEGQQVRLLGNWVASKYVRTIKGDIMYFGTFLDEQGCFFDTVHFPAAVKAYPLSGQGVYLILGKVVLEFGFPSVQVEKLAKLPIKADPRGK